MTTTTTAAPAPALTARRRHLMGAGATLTVGVLVSALAEVIHPHQEPANDHHRVFAEYAASTAWTWVHYLQFAAALTVIIGFLLLHAAITAYGHDSVLARLGSATGVATLAVFPIPTARRAWIEDVIVDEPSTGKGVGAALTEAMSSRRTGRRASFRRRSS